MRFIDSRTRRAEALTKGIREVAGTMHEQRSTPHHPMAREVGKDHVDAALLLGAISALAVQLTERGIKSVPRFDLVSRH